MKKITFLLIMLSCFSGFAQFKSTGTVNLTSNMTANLTLNNTTSVATLSLSGPNDRWFALQFGSFTGGMEDGADLVYWNGSNLIDARHNGIGTTPTNDATNNWTLVSNSNNTPATGLRTLVYTRPFSTGDSNDYTFNYADGTIDFAWAKMSSASFSLAYHGAGNRDVMVDMPITTALGTEDFSLNATQVYPNPSKGNFTVKTKTTLERINVYSQTGSLVKAIDVDNQEEVEVNMSGLQTGVYLLELQNSTEKSWKKIIIN